MPGSEFMINDYSYFYTHMSTKEPETREGGLDAPTRHPIDWKNPEYFNEDLLYKEQKRVFNICHGC